MFDYFYKRETEAFRFIKVPLVLLEDEKFKKLSSDAVLLYSIMLQRANLSYKNNWLDDEGRIYIYFTLNEIMTTFNKASEKAVKIMKELENSGLIEKKRQGLGKPNIIYVKNFMSGFEEKLKNNKSMTSEIETQDFENRNSGTSKNETQNFENRNSGTSKNETQDFRKSKCSYIDINKTDISKIDFNKAKIAMGTYKNFYLTKEEYNELQSQIGYLDDLIERLSNYMQSSGKTYKDHKATIMTWYIREKPKVQQRVDKEEYYKTDLGL